MTDAFEPLPFVWGGDAFRPHPQAKARADDQYEVGVVYRLAVEEARSDLSHRHEFAFVREAWKTLPEALSAEYPTPDHLRKRALIQAGYYDEQIIDAGSHAAALRVAAGVRSFPGEGFSMVFVRGAFVIIRRPKSQSYRAMGKKVFSESKVKILEVIADMIGVDVSKLERAAA